MSHSPDHVESQITEQSPEAQQQVAAAARRGLANEAAVELSSPPGKPAGTDAQEQALLMAQQGLKDLASGDSAKAILELMQASVARPDLVRSQDFISSLHQIAPDSTLPANHSHEVTISQPAQGQQQPAAQEVAQNTTVQPDTTAATPTGGDTQVLQQQSMAVAQQGLSDIVSGNGASGILKLMQAAQMNPGILQDSRFINALQSALTSAKGSGSQATIEQSITPGQAGTSTEQAALAANNRVENFRTGAS